MDESHDGENCILKYFTINILYFFENDLRKTRVTKTVIFKKNAETRFCLNIEVDRKEKIVYKNNNMLIQNKTVNTSVSFIVGAHFLFLNQSSSLIVTISYPVEES